MKFLILLLLFFHSTYSQNLSKDEIDEYVIEINSKSHIEYSIEIFEGFYKKKHGLFHKPYSGSIRRNEQGVIVHIDEIIGNFNPIYDIYYKDKTPIYILISKEKRGKQKKPFELYFINSEYAKTISSRKFKLKNVVEHANDFYLRESIKSN